MDRTAVCRRFFLREKFGCSGQLDLGLVGIVGRGLLVMTRIGDDTSNLWFFPPTVPLDFFFSLA